MALIADIIGRVLTSVPGCPRPVAEDYLRLSAIEFCRRSLVWTDELAAIDLPVMSTVTITIASPAVVSWSSHGFSAGDTVIFSTTGDLPTGLVAGTTYYISAVGLVAGSFQISATNGGASINTSGTQSGDHSGYPASFFPYAVIAEASEAKVRKILSVIVNGLSPGLEEISIREAESMTDNWRTATGTAQYFVEHPTGCFSPVPLPGAAASVVFTVAYEPTDDATSLPDALVDDWLTPIVSGAVMLLSVIPNKPWTSGEMFNLHSAIFRNGIDDAKRDLHFHRVMPLLTTSPSYI